MEKIKEALAKVKLGKKEASNGSRESRQRTLPKDNLKATSSDIGNIEYTTSTVVKLDASHLEENRIVSHLNHNVTSSVFDSLRTQVLQKMEENNWKTLAIVSPTPESGKTLTSINLAISIAHQPQKTVVLVDFDLRRPRVAKYLGINKNVSMNEYIENKVELKDIIVNPSIQRLVILPTMRSITRSSDALSSSKVEELIKELKERYESRIVIFDLPPVLNSDDAMVLLPHIDCVLMVVANGVSTPSEIEDALHLMPKDNLLGIVYNKADEERKAYYY